MTFWAFILRVFVNLRCALFGCEFPANEYCGCYLYFCPRCGREYFTHKKPSECRKLIEELPRVDPDEFFWNVDGD